MDAIAEIVAETLRLGSIAVLVWGALLTLGELLVRGLTGERRSEPRTQGDGES